MILTKAIDMSDPSPIHYSIKKTGFYCVVTDKYTADKYQAVVEFRNAYGELEATQIPKLPFYGGVTILYALVAVYWGFLYYQHRQDIRELPCALLPALLLTLHSGRPELHHGNLDILGH